MMKSTAHFQKLVEDTCQEVLDDEHPVPVDAVGGQEHRGFEGSGHPGHEGLLLGTPCSQGTDPHGHQRPTAVLACEKPFAAVMRVVRDADASVMAGEGVGHA
jgi:hypothetical protein